MENCFIPSNIPVLEYNDQKNFFFFFFAEHILEIGFILDFIINNFRIIESIKILSQ